MKAAPSLAARNRRFLLALAPGAMFACLLHFPDLPLRIAAAAALALLLEAIFLRLRKLPVRAYLSEGSAIRAAVLLGLWLPTLALPTLLGALAIALLLRQLLGGLGGARYSAAMLGAAIAQLGVAATPMPADAGAPWLALAWLGGGLALVGAGQLRWQGPLALLATAALCALPAGGALGLLTAAPWLLAAFFLLAESNGDGESATTRLLVGAIAGALAVLAARGQATATMLPYALLAANALSPWLSRRLATPRRQPA